MNSVNETDARNRTYYFSDDMINIKNLGPNKIKAELKSYKSISVYRIAYERP